MKLSGKPSGLSTKLMLTLCLLFTAADLSAQEQRVSLSGRTLVIREAFRQIENQTGLIIGINTKLLDDTRSITLIAPEGTAGELLSQILAGRGLTYRMNGNHVILVPIPRATNTVAATAIRPQNAGAGAQAPEATQGVGIATVTQRFELEPLPEPVLPPRGDYPVVRNLTGTPRVALKTNLLIDATASISLGVEFRTGRKTTLDLPFSYNGWDFSNNRKWKHFLVQPAFRWWLCESFNGHFFGAHAHYAEYNVGNLPSPPFSATMQNYRFDGWLAGGGLSYGYHWILGKRWSLEAEIGLGYARLQYDKYPCEKCGTRIARETKNYWGPTKAGLSLIFMIK